MTDIKPMERIEKMSKIEQIITEIEEFIDQCGFVPLSSTKIIVNKEELEELLAELRLKTPEEIKKYQRMISNRDAILNEAKERAEAMLNEAKEQTSELVSEHEIMQQAYIQANDIVQQATEHAQEILDRATEDANNIRMGAMQYTDESLANLENLIAHSIENFNARYDVMMKSLTQSLEIVAANRNELNPEEEEPEQKDSTVKAADSGNTDYEDYTVPIDLDDEE